MIQKVLYTISIVLVFSFGGCSWHAPWYVPDPIIQDKLVYVQKPISKVNEPPKAFEYQINYVQVNGKDYYFMTLESGEILNTNWARYKEWSMTNFNILKDLEQQYLESNQTKDK